MTERRYVPATSRKQMVERERRDLLSSRQTDAMPSALRSIVTETTAAGASRAMVSRNLWTDDRNHRPLVIRQPAQIGLGVVVKERPQSRS